MKTFNSVRLIALIVSLTFLRLNTIAAESNGEVKDFRGDIRPGNLMSRFGDEFHRVAVFTDLTKPAVIRLAEDTVSDDLLNDLCKNGDGFMFAPAGVRQLDKQKFIPGIDFGVNFGNSLHIAVFPNKAIKVAKELEGTAIFESGSITKVDEVIKKYGKPMEKEAWTQDKFQSLIGLNAIVYWWGAVGIAGSSNEDGEGQSS